MSVSYLPLALLFAFIGWRVVSVLAARRKIPAWLRAGALVLDVRTPAEFAAGHAAHSVNIPLAELAGRTASLDPAKPVIVCCASGTRSGVARRLLRQRGFTQVLNAGSWRNLTP